MPEHARRHTAVSCTKMAEPIEMPFGLWTRVVLRKHVLYRRGADWRHPANTTEPSVCGDDAAFLSYHFDLLFQKQLKSIPRPLFSRQFLQRFLYTPLFLFLKLQ